MRFFTLLFLNLLLIVITSASCRNNENSAPVHDKFELMEVDRSFSRLSEEKGLKVAYIEYLDSNGVMLRPGHMPIDGADAIDYIISRQDTSYIVTWSPSDASIAGSGDLGYTYGVYSVIFKGRDTPVLGTYVTVWKKQQDGSWKFVLDSGNEGIGNHNGLSD